MTSRPLTATEIIQLRAKSRRRFEGEYHRSLLRDWQTAATDQLNSRYKEMEQCQGND